MVAARLKEPSNSLLEFLLERISPEDILAYQAIEAVKERAEKNKAGTLTPEEALYIKYWKQIAC